jgi:AraC family transcriptional regulator
LIEMPKEAPKKISSETAAREDIAAPHNQQKGQRMALQTGGRVMNKPIFDPLQALLVASSTRQGDLPAADPRPADAEMARVLKTAPLRMASDPSSGAIAHWKHGALHDVVEPMADHVIMTYPTGVQRLERRSGSSVAIGTARSGVVTIIPAGSSARWDIPGLVNVVQLYLPHKTLARVAGEAHAATPSDLLERTGHPDPITSRLLLSAADVLDGNEALDALFRHQVTDLLATRLLAAHSGSPTMVEPIVGGLSPTVLRRAIERLRSDSDADVSLAALASDAGLSRFHFCRAFKESTGLSPHAWLRQYRLEQAMTMLRDTDASIVTVAAELGYASQTAFAAAFRRLTGETPSDWRRRMR